MPESVLTNLQAEACNIIKKKTLAQVFSSEFCEISMNIFSCRTPLLPAPASLKVNLMKNILMLVYIDWKIIIGIQKKI